MMMPVMVLAGTILLIWAAVIAGGALLGVKGYLSLPVVVVATVLSFVAVVVFTLISLVNIVMGIGFDDCGGHVVALQDAAYFCVFLIAVALLAGLGMVMRDWPYETR